ncbi:DegV family protein [Enterococcus hirae]|nr:DegV family protein [Enterococcus hirae]
MTKIKIVTDSSCILTQEDIEKYNIHVVPLSVMIDGTIYTPPKNLTYEKFMELMAESKSLPKTSQPPLGAFLELYEELTKDGSQVLSIHLTESLSGTVETAKQAAKMVQGAITVVDSAFVDQGTTFQVLKAAELAEKGSDLSTILAEIKKVRDHTVLYLGLSSLENLVKGGRINRAVGLISSFFNVKVVMQMEHGDLFPKAKGRGDKTFAKWFEQLKTSLQKQASDVARIGISYAGDSGKEIVKKFKIELQQILPDLEIPVVHTTPIVSTHTGPGAFAVIFYTK